MGKEWDYTKNIKEEAGFWGTIASSFIQYGIPQWVDYRRCSKKKGFELPPSANEIYYDIQLWKTFRGNTVEKMMGKALEKKGKVLDLVCGAGWLSLELAREGMDVIGIDLSPEMLTLANTFRIENPFKEKLGKLAYRVEDLNIIELLEKEYDVITAFDGLHHIWDLEKLLKKVKNALKDDGIFLVYDHIGSERLMEMLNRILSRFLYLILPQRGGIKEKVSRIMRNVRGIFGGNTLELTRSPFEDVGAKEMVKFIENHFYIERKETSLCLFLSGMIISNSKVPRGIRVWLCKTLKGLDDFLVNSFLIQGEYVYIEARKK